MHIVSSSISPMQQHAAYPAAPRFGSFSSQSAPYQPNSGLYPQLPAFGSVASGSGPSMGMASGSNGFQSGSQQQNSEEAPFVDVPVSVSVPASMAERHRAQYEELARLQRQELLQLANQPSYGPGSQNGGSVGGGMRYGGGQDGQQQAFRRSFSAHDGSGMYLGLGDQDRPSPGSPGSQGQAHQSRSNYNHGHDNGYGAIDGLYHDVKKRRVEPVYDASEYNRQ